MKVLIQYSCKGTVGTLRDESVISSSQIYILRLRQYEKNRRDWDEGNSASLIPERECVREKAKTNHGSIAPHLRPCSLASAEQPELGN